MKEKMMNDHSSHDTEHWQDGWYCFDCHTHYEMSDLSETVTL